MTTEAPASVRTPDLDADYERALRRGLLALRHGVDAILDDLAAQGGGIPGLNYLTGGYRADAAYVWDSWAGFQWVGFLCGKLWHLHRATGDDRYAEAALGYCRRIGPVLAEQPAVWSATGTDIYYGLCLGAEVTGEAQLRDWALAAARNLEHVFRYRAQAFIQILSADRIVIDTGLNLPPFFWAARR